MGDEIYLTELETEILKVFVKRKITTNQGIREVLEDLIEKLYQNQSN